jgi:hypothetical protein
MIFVCRANLSMLIYIFTYLLVTLVIVKLSFRSRISDINASYVTVATRAL